MNIQVFATGLPIEACVRELAASAPLWDAFTYRQDFNESPHKDTKCIPLRGAFRVADSFVVNTKRERTEFAFHLPATMALINHVLSGMPVASVGNAMAVSLRPGGKITPHADEGEYADHFERMHIVLTGTSVYLCGTESLEPKPGEAFTFNHHITHSAENFSDKERVHLIVDYTLKE